MNYKSWDNYGCQQLDISLVRYAWNMAQIQFIEFKCFDRKIEVSMPIPFKSNNIWKASLIQLFHKKKNLKIMVYHPDILASN